MATELDTSNQCCHSVPVEQVVAGNSFLPSNTVQHAKLAPSAATIKKNKFKNIVLNGGLITFCLIGITVITVGSAALMAIDGLGTIDRPEFLSKVPLTIALMASALSGVGIVYLMVKVLLAMGDDFDFGDHD